MKDEDKSKEQLILDLSELRQRLSEYEAAARPGEEMLGFFFPAHVRIFTNIQSAINIGPWTWESLSGTSRFLDRRGRMTNGLTGEIETSIFRSMGRT